MAFKAPQGNQQERVKQDDLEADVYPGRLVQLIGLGLQAQKPYQGQDKKPVHEIMLTYELSYEFMKDEDGNDLEDKPRWQSETIPFHPLVADKAKSTLRYKAFDPDNQFDGDWSKCVDIPVNITLVQNKSGDKVYVNVANVAPMSAKKAAQVPELKNPVKIFNPDEPDMEVYNKLPKWVQEKIVANLNFKGSVLEKAIGNAAKEAQGNGAKTQEAAKDDAEKNNNPY